MLFNSLEFVLFIAAFAAVWPLLRRSNNTRWACLVVFSLFFYGWWDWRYVFLLIATGLVDYAGAVGMDLWPRHRKALLIGSLACNLGTLIGFKYLGFLIDNTNVLAGAAGFDFRLTSINPVLPIGISFYTFQSLNYTIDVYRGIIKPTRNLLHFFAYLSIFPHLVAGPIVRASHLLPQLERYSHPSESQRWDGLKLIIYGYFKKMVIADALAPTVAVAFGAAGVVASGAYWWLIAAMFAMQIYGDFSGYSDIARGLAKWMGYDFPVNFNQPYLATSFSDFWRRWHISLSSWFRDYVYLPLGGSRVSAFRAHLNLWITMLVSGFWHGAAWTFVAWGALHAACLSIERITDWPKRLMRLPGGRFVATALVLVGVLSGWVLFRAQTFAQAGAILATMFTPSVWNAHVIRETIHWRELIPLALIGLHHLFYLLRLHEIEWKAPRWRPALHPIVQPVALATLAWACVYLRGPGNVFIYFQF